MKKQILNVSLLLASSATIIAIWALPKQGKEEDALYVRDYKEDILVSEEVKDSTKEGITNGKEKKNDSTKDSMSVNVTEKQVPSFDESQKHQKEKKTKLTRKTTVKTDTIGSNIELEDVKWVDYGRGLKFRKVKRNEPLEEQGTSADSTY